MPKPPLLLIRMMAQLSPCFYPFSLEPVLETHTNTHQVAFLKPKSNHFTLLHGPVIVAHLTQNKFESSQGFWALHDQATQYFFLLTLFSMLIVFQALLTPCPSWNTPACLSMGFIVPGPCDRIGISHFHMSNFLISLKSLLKSSQ